MRHRNLTVKHAIAFRSIRNSCRCICRLFACTAVVLFAANSRCFADDSYRWKNVTVGGGGFVPGIVFSRVEKGLCYLRSDMGGCYRWDSGANTWVPLNDQLAESSYMGGESIAPDPVDANTVYIAAGMYHGEPAAMLRSHDRGTTWDVFPVAFHMGGNEDGRGLGERLSVDPCDPNILYFASRFDGLMRSDDRAATWKPVESFPLHGVGLPKRGQPSSGGLSFVLFDAGSGKHGTACKQIFVASADPGPAHLFRSSDGGSTWKPIAGGPSSDMLPAKGEIDDDGRLVITYGDGIGPNGVKNGAVFAFDSHHDQWADLTPDPIKGRGGYCGVSIDRQTRGGIAVATIDHWSPTDTIWHSVNGGKTWNQIAEKSVRDVTATPFLLWGRAQPRLGWWMTALAIDPFDSNHAVYATGATIYESHDFLNVDQGRSTQWKSWTEGIEQTAIITLLSPTSGPHLISGFGDIGGFVHDDLDRSPPQGMFEHPHFTNTDGLNDAGVASNVIVRVGRPDEGEAAFAVSDDSGKTWQPLSPPDSKANRRASIQPSIIVSADGKSILVTAAKASITVDRGKTFEPVGDLPKGVDVIADRVNPQAFYGIDFDDGKIWVSEDAGHRFHSINSTGLPAQRGKGHLYAAPGELGRLWLTVNGNLYKSTDAANTFVEARSTLQIEMISFGRAAPGKLDPTLFSVGTMNSIRAVWRSDDSGETWTRLTDASHEWGRRFRCIAGDMRLFGRVYVGTDGRGIFYGDPTASSSAETH